MFLVLSHLSHLAARNGSNILLPSDLPDLTKSGLRNGSMENVVLFMNLANVGRPVSPAQETARVLPITATDHGNRPTQERRLVAKTRHVM